MGPKLFFVLTAACAAVACGARSELERNDGPALDASFRAPHAGADPPPNECPFRSVRIDLTQTGVLEVSDRIEVEPLQIPSFSAETMGDLVHPAPAVWDRSPVPVGACVFRLRGVEASCYRTRAQLFLGPCDEHLVSPSSFYEQRGCHAVPGCAGSEWSIARRDGYWWYLAPAGSDSHLVICAAECANEIRSRGACLFLYPDVDGGCP